MKTKVVTDYNHESFNRQVNQLAEQGWEIIPETFKIKIAAGNNRAYGVVLKKDE